MAKIKIPIPGTIGKSVHLDPDATPGAKVGVNLLDPNGDLVKWSDILNPPSSNTGSTFNGTSDDVPEGQWNLYFTDQRAQDAVGGILTDTADIDFSYDGSLHEITAVLTNTGVSAGTYGDAGHIPVVTVDAHGRITSIVEVPVQTSVFMPVVNGDVPPVLVYLDNGTLVYTQVA